jgi:hypothetical protein
VGRGWARGAGHRIGARRTKFGFGDAAVTVFWSGASQVTLGDVLGDATDALTTEVEKLMCFRAWTVLLPCDCDHESPTLKTGIANPIYVDMKK